MGKTPAQIAAIAERIVAAGHNLLVTRTTLDAHAAVSGTLPGAEFPRAGPHHYARARRGPPWQGDES